MPGRRDLAAFAVAVAGLIGLGAYGLVEPSDARYAEIAREMWASGDWLFPRLLGILHFHKPPLIYWLSGLGYALFGPSEWAARAVQGGLLLLLCGMLWAFTRRHLGRQAAPWAVALVATTPAVIGASHLLTTDLLLAVCLTLALTAWFDVWRGRGGRGAVARFYLGCALAFLAKGPVGWVLLVLILVPFAWWGRSEGRRQVPWHPLLGAGAVLALAAPWYLYVIGKTPGLLEYFLGGQLASRLHSGSMGHPHPWHYFLYVFPALGLPWLLLGPCGWRNLRLTDAGLARFLLLWAVVPPLFFSVPATKLPLYVLLSYPALAALGAAGLVGRQQPRGAVRAAGLGFVLLGLALGVAGLGGIPLRGGDLERVSAAARAWVLLPPAVAVAAAGALACRWARGPGGAGRGALALVLALGITTPWVFTQGDRLPLRTARTVGRAAARELGPDDTLVEYRTLAAGLPWYAGRQPLLADFPRETRFERPGATPRLLEKGRFQALWRAEGRVLVVTRPRRRKELPGAVELARGGGYVLLANH